MRNLGQWLQDLYYINYGQMAPSIAPFGSLRITAQIGTIQISSQLEPVLRDRDKLVEVAHNDCCWGALTLLGHTELMPRNDREGFLLMIHQLVRS